MKRNLTIIEYYLLRVGSFNNNHNGDLYDNLFKNQWLAIGCCDDKKQTIFVENFNLPLKQYCDASFWDIASEIAPKLNTTINQNILIGLLRSTFDYDFDGLIDAEFDINNVFICQEKDLKDFSNIFHYSICSKTNLFKGLSIDDKDKKIIMANGDKCKLGELYGQIDEDESWVVALVGK